jgi:3-phenylpropionate/trans-cinnamate dioxygenase ferredoxin reductase subunit
MTTDPRHSPDVDVAVVGAGIAGFSAVQALRGAGFTGSVLMVGDEPRPPYRRPAVSKELVRGTRTVDEVGVRPAGWYAQNDVDLQVGVRVTRLDVARRELTLDGRGTVRAGRVVLATGGRARSPWEGERVRTLRTADDAEALAGALDRVERVVVVGAGLVGSEIAAAVRARGPEVTLLESAPLPLPRLLPPPLAARYVDLHARHGTKLETGVQVCSVRENAGEGVVTAEDGRSWRGGLVLVAVGMEPDLALAGDLDRIGSPGGGVLVDWAGATSAPGVFAAGDVALRPTSYLPPPAGPGTQARLRCEHWQGAQNHGAAVGRALAGESVRFDEVPWSWSEQYGVTLQVAGWPDHSDRLVLRGDPEGDAFTAFTLREGVLRGAVTVGRPADVRAARTLVAQRARPSVAGLADPDVPVGETVGG